MPELGDSAYVSLTIVESVNGSVVGGVALRAFKADGTLYSSATTNASGKATLKVPPASRCTILAGKTDSAQSSLVFLSPPTKGESVSYALVVPALGMETRDASAPVISAVEISYDNDASRETVTNQSVISTEAPATLFVTAKGANAIDKTAWSGFGVKAGLDIVPSAFNGESGTENYTGQSSGDETLPYESAYSFDLSGAEFSGEGHELIIVAYDVANNRTEVRIPVTIEALSSAGTAPLDGCEISDLYANLRTYGESCGWFSKDGSSTKGMTQVDGENVSYRALLNFSVLKSDGVTNQAIRGFKVYRSADSTDYDYIGALNYGYLSQGSNGIHAYYDADSKLENGKVYYYKVVAFTSATETLASNVAAAKVTTPFTASLVSPAIGSTVDIDEANRTGPEFRFRLSDTSLWNATASDCFYFALYVRDKDGDIGYIGYYCYYFGNGLFYFYHRDSQDYYPFEEYGGENSDYISYSGGVITISDLVTFLGETNYATGGAMDYAEGATYEWDIISDYDATNGHSPCYFSKQYTKGISRTYADASSTGGNTTNGAFEFIAE